MNNLELFQQRVLEHAKHISDVGQYCTTEETTKQALILPMLGILGFSPYDPTKVRAEYFADLPGIKNGERVDYALFCQSVPVMLIEAKPYKENLNNHAPQLMRYFNASPEVEFAIITNGREWRFFTDLKNKNVMDDKPFLTINFEKLDKNKVKTLFGFHHDTFQPETLRLLAEENTYLSAFTKTISASLREVDNDFVRYVASRSNTGRQLTQKFIDSITPLVKQAIQKSVSEMVVSGLSSPEPIKTAEQQTEDTDNTAETENLSDIVDPQNGKIITTVNEQTLFNLVVFLLGEDTDIECKDTESYFSILYQGKTNRWLLRYFGDKQKPYISVPFDLSDQHKKAIERAKLTYNGNNIQLDDPQYILRLGGLIFDCLSYCEDDDNFRKK